MADKTIKALKGTESILLILPKEVGNRLNIEHQAWLTFEVRNKELILKKIENEDKYQEVL